MGRKEVSETTGSILFNRHEQSVEGSKSQISVPVPPITPSWLDKLEDLASLKRLTIHKLESNLRVFPSTRRQTENLYKLHNTVSPIKLQTRRDPQDGKVVAVVEVCSSSHVQSSKNSTSLTRALRPRNEGFKGTSLNLPFWPGGIEQDFDEQLDNSAIDSTLFDLLEASPLDSGSAFAGDNNGIAMEDFETLAKSNVHDRGRCNTSWKNNAKEPFYKFTEEIPDDIFNSTGDARPVAQVLKISQTPCNFPQALRWAEQVDITGQFVDFQEKVPDMAFKFPFELDNFQKHAICKLEEHENVFVAAHTSAGKTVVAEYAIALSMRHMTRTIYTSPIKALSNQKFRDFRNNFDSVGLVTGDVQINTNASCLIMTTEILRSMLYNGSDVIRDLEWVIFDEIHYLNNQERGHVWEEVLIMLPHHVSIIMLSATVPNALQFANWVGKIKKRRIFVIATSKRPVPLEHYLYTGTGGASRDERFLVLDESGRFLKLGYEHAKQALLSRMSNYDKRFGARSSRRNTFDTNAEKTLFVGLVDHLKRRDELPVVIFTFSRARCDTYANLLSSVDLCTAKQKSEIHHFFNQSLGLLKGSDRELPQVLQVQEMLKNGIGVHHSGILPILKEVVELLFQNGLVKLLFATETFAMGVNMPARTVVFDSFRKHDGFQFRSLIPAEYIQMAGRAGRRGLDTTGKVLLLCKKGAPDITELQSIIQGNAAKLESQFRLTYNMLLNLLRVESLSVEDVMKRSFMEAGTITALKSDDIKRKLTEVTSLLEDSYSTLDRMHTAVQFYNQVTEYLVLRESLVKTIMENERTIDELCRGRLVVFELLPKYNTRLGAILSTGAGNTYRILTLTSELDRMSLKAKNLAVSDEPAAQFIRSLVGDMLNRMFQLYLYYGHDALTDFVPDRLNVYHEQWTVLSVPADRICEILGNIIHVEPDLLEVYNRPETPKRRCQMLRPMVVNVVSQLHRFSCALARKEFWPLLFEPLSQKLYNRGLNSATIMKIKQLERIRRSLKIKNYFAACPDFFHKFRRVFFRMKLTDEKHRLEYLLSPKSLKLHKEYEAMTEVLRKLGYIDSESMVLLKGRFACEMGNQNELMVTEMVFNGIFTNCSPLELAAILSCVVCEGKKAAEPSLAANERLKLKVQEIKSLARKIGLVQRECGMTASVDNFVDQFRFGLVEVVYDWADGKPFSDIMRLTDIQEGIIVRTIQRLDEILKNLKDGARIIGDPGLRMKVERASELIKRDIVFAMSLYTQ